MKRQLWIGVFLTAAGIAGLLYVIWSNWSDR